MWRPVYAFGEGDRMSLESRLRSRSGRALEVAIYDLHMGSA